MGRLDGGERSWISLHGEVEAVEMRIDCGPGLRALVLSGIQICTLLIV
jgi:hypothetical protein